MTSLYKPMTSFQRKSSWLKVWGSSKSQARADELSPIPSARLQDGDELKPRTKQMTSWRLMYQSLILKSVRRNGKIRIQVFQLTFCVQEATEPRVEHARYNYKAIFCIFFLNSETGAKHLCYLSCFDREILVGLWCVVVLQWALCLSIIMTTVPTPTCLMSTLRFRLTLIGLKKWSR